MVFYQTEIRLNLFPHQESNLTPPFKRRLPTPVCYRGMLTPTPQAVLGGDYRLYFFLNSVIKLLNTVVLKLLIVVELVGIEPTSRKVQTSFALPWFMQPQI